MMMAYVGPAAVKFSTCGWLSLMSPSHLEPAARSSWVEYHVNRSCSTPFSLQTGRIASLVPRFETTPSIIFFSLFNKVSFNTLSCRRLSWTLCLPRPLDLLIPGMGLLISFPWEHVLVPLLSWCLKCVRHSIRFLIAALANHHNLVALKNRNAFSYTSGAQKFGLSLNGAQSRCGRGSLPREGSQFPCLFQLLVPAGISSLRPLCSNSARFVSWPSHLLFGL